MNLYAEKNYEMINAGFYAILDNTDAMIFMKDLRGVYMACSLPFAQMAGKTSIEDILGRTDFDIFDNQDLAAGYVSDDHKLLAAGQNLVDYVEPITDDHGHYRYSKTSKYILKNQEDGGAIGILGISRDITRDYLARQRHQQEIKYLFELPADTYAALFMDINDWRIIRHHSREVNGQSISVCATMEEFRLNALAQITEENEEARQFFTSLSRKTMQEMYESGKRRYSLEYSRKMPNQNVQWVHVDIHLVVDPENGHQCAIWLLQDIDRIRQENMEVLYAAEHDALTGLLNRAAADKYITEALDKYSDSLHALFIIDVDNFKLLNDTLGHQEGDRFLIALAQMLQSSFRESDIVSRLGGDEFLILMKNVANELSVVEKADTILALCQIICNMHEALGLSISVGISLYPKDGTTLHDLYKKADYALYEAKQEKNTFVLATEY